MSDNKAPDEKVRLTKAEEDFCYLYVYGDKDFAGQHTECYEEVFGEVEKSSILSRKFLSQPHIQSRIHELQKEMQSETETIAVKLQVSETLRSVMKETASAQFTDKFGVSLSPAPLRAVSVNAAKALSDLYPIKHAHESKSKNDGAGGITFNVIVPERAKEKPVE